MEYRIDPRKSISREPETRRWFPEPGKKEPRTNINRTAKRLFFFTLVLNIIIVLKYNFKISTGAPYLFVFSLENTSVIAGAGQANFPEAVHYHFCGTPKKIYWYRFSCRVIFAFLVIVPWDYFEKRSLFLQPVIALKEESNMAMQMKFNFASEESVRFLATLDEKTLRKVVELMAQMIVRVQEKRKEEKHV